MTKQTYQDLIESIKGTSAIDFEPFDSVQGFTFSGSACGIKPSKKDLGILSSKGMSVAAVLTPNKYAAEAVSRSRKYLKIGESFDGIIITSGNANACTGERGIECVDKILSALAIKLATKPERLLIAQTGLIGILPPVERIVEGIHHSSLSDKGFSDLSEAILTTDTVKKVVHITYNLGEKNLRFAFAAKGVAMCSPAMATMITVGTTDGTFSQRVMQQALNKAVAKTFNMMSIDACMSTNDSVFLCASNQVSLGLREEDQHNLLVEVLETAFRRICIMMCADAEKCSKVMQIEVKNAATQEQAETVAKLVVNNLLFKTAVAGEAPYWGRALAAAGAYAGELPQKVDIYFGDHLLCVNSAPSGLNIAAAEEYMQSQVVNVIIDLKGGTYRAVAYGTDITPEYVKFNMEKS